MNNNACVKVIGAGRGWYRIWRGRDLVAACPNEKMASRILAALRAEEDLEIAQAKIQLLEETLERELRVTPRFLGLVRR